MLDTNILISIAIFDSKRLKELLIKICDKYTLVLSQYIIEELRYVTNKKFPDKKRDLEKFLFKLPYELKRTPSVLFDTRMIKIRDVKDIPILYSAIISDVDIFITGDKDFYDVDIKRPKIMTASKFLEIY